MSKYILIAEDDAFLSKMYKFHLSETEGWEVEVARNGEEAVVAMDKKKPDILLLDLLMPKLDGYGVLEHKTKKGYKFPVIILSNLSQEVDRAKCSEMGAVDYFVKSETEMEDLSEKIKKYFK